MKIGPEKVDQGPVGTLVMNRAKKVGKGRALSGGGRDRGPWRRTGRNT